ncbi:hypothetical protein Ae201684_000546 [Aphanomyces euteiches]|uniref:Uncharacterized protein n=1 Tax=Aphanomyces euteiches TaxID=100861 RepID=A0A6G0XWP5_9STRA|nr:hypothetical protein Ae201684_000546 [Aphanomyces euteiches]
MVQRRLGFFLFDVALFGDVDTIQKLTDILFLDQAGLGDVGAVLGDLGQVDAAQFNLILDIGRADVGHTFRQSDAADTLFTQKVADFNGVLFKGHVDGKVGIHETHLVQETHTDTRDHVFDVRAHRADASQLLAVAEPQVDTQGLLVHAAHVQGHVREVAGDGAALAAHGDLAAIKGELDIIRDFNETGAEQLAHLGGSGSVLNENDILMPKPTNFLTGEQSIDPISQSKNFIPNNSI